MTTTTTTTAAATATTQETDQLPPSEREQTDASLRLERERVDSALEAAIIDEHADSIISRARTRADAVLAAARAKTDRQSATSAATVIIERERIREDTALRTERADADETLRQERAEHVVLLSNEREETDKDLLIERTRSDAALATRDEFLGIVSHDLREMLNAAVSSATLIETTASVEETHLHIRRIQRAGRRMDRLIGDLVDVASIEAGTLAVTSEPGDLAAVVTEAVETFQARAAAGGLSLTTAIAPLSSPVAFDAARILQVLTNLLSNAIKFTAPGGTVAVSVEDLGTDVRIAVSDTGLGIPADKLELIFNRFLQVSHSDRRGVGLGLYISKCIVLGHGGRIWAEQRTGGGSILSMTLPVARHG